MFYRSCMRAFSTAPFGSKFWLFTFRDIYQRGMGLRTEGQVLTWLECVQPEFNPQHCTCQPHLPALLRVMLEPETEGSHEHCQLWLPTPSLKTKISPIFLNFCMSTFFVMLSSQCWVFFEQSQEAWAWPMVLAYLFSPFNTVNISKSNGEPLCCDHHLKSYSSQMRTWNLELAATNGLLTAEKEVVLQLLTQEHWREKSSFESSREACWLANISSEILKSGEKIQWNVCYTYLRTDCLFHVFAICSYVSLPYTTRKKRKINCKSSWSVASQQIRQLADKNNYLSSFVSEMDPARILTGMGMAGDTWVSS